MGLLLFLLAAGVLVIVTYPLLKRGKYILWTIGGILISSIIISVNGIYSVCKDGWVSYSIGKQGACSWHGGVVTKLNDFGLIVLWVSLIIIIGTCIGVFIYISYKEKKDKMSGKREVSKEQREENKCPECGGKLIKRKGKYGEFMGCNNYPKCRYTEKI